MTTATAPAPAAPAVPSPGFFPPDAPFLPRLALRRDVAGGGRGFASSAAFIALSPALVCVLDSPTASAATHQEIGAAGFTVHQAWNRAAEVLLEAASASAGAEFWVRGAQSVLGDAAPPGLQVRGDAARWLAHPRLFSVLHSHFSEVLRPERGLTYLTRDCRELFVFDAPAGALARVAGSPSVMRYSLGFPLLLAA
ncbi:hypothetical protein [Corynebacterium sp. UBA2622]|uniref:hypothetical protein n=1 Tax=Corynebacterium sp. UBA2622 TaxID=1946393 RepID=UPI0025B86F5F|nr:hypothetical protein [Corynebacterium sp. UBA2622]